MRETWAPCEAKARRGHFQYAADGAVGHEVATNGGERWWERSGHTMGVSDERLWVVVNREKFRTRGKNLRWEYPAARIELFLRKNFEIKQRTYLWTVFLWDRSRGQFQQFRD